jgi:hypothetical protein
MITALQRSSHARIAATATTDTSDGGIVDHPKPKEEGYHANVDRHTSTTTTAVATLITAKSSLNLDELRSPQVQQRLRPTMNILLRSRSVSSACHTHRTEIMHQSSMLHTRWNRFRRSFVVALILLYISTTTTTYFQTTTTDPHSTTVSQYHCHALSSSSSSSSSKPPTSLPWQDRTLKIAFVTGNAMKVRTKTLLWMKYALRS